MSRTTKSLSYGDVVGEFKVKFVSPNPFCKRKNKTSFFLCPICNKDFLSVMSEIKTGKIRGCCVPNNRPRYPNRLRNIWHAMKSRVVASKDRVYRNYGKKKINICNEWTDFIDFQFWALNNGYEASLTLDRIDSSLGYCPENCRWASYSEQSRNKKNNVWWIIDGVKMCQKDVLGYLSVSETTVWKWRTKVRKIPKKILDRVTSITKEGVELISEYKDIRLT